MDFHFLVFLFSFATTTFFLIFQRFLASWISRRFCSVRRCKCDICHSFLTGQWREKFDSLPDWHAYLLRTSPSKTVHIHVLNNIITAHPKNVEHILRSNFDNYPKGKPFSAILGDLLGRGIFIVDGPHWRFQRKLASLQLGSLSIRAFAHQILTREIRTYLLPSLMSESTVDLQEVFKKLSFDNICRFSFGVEPDCFPGGSGLSDAFDLASALSAQRALHPSSLAWRVKRALNFGSERSLRAAIGTVNAFADRIINERRKEGFDSKNDLLSRFMGNVTDDKYLRDIVISFLLAGRDTVASGLTVFFYLVARNPEAEARILEEVNRVASDVATLEQLREMHFLHASLYEALRLFPPVQMDSKWAINDDVLPDGTHVRKGTRVSYHPYGMGRVEEIWGSDCLQFRPERWLNEEGSFRPESPFKYPVFQAGPRVCLGKDMALLSTKAVAFALLKRFEIRLAAPGWTPRFVPGLTATLSGGLPVVVRERSLSR